MEQEEQIYEEEYDYQDFMQRLQLKFEGIYPELRPYSPARYPLIAKQYDSLDQELKTLYNQLFKEPTKSKYPKPIEQLRKEQDFDDYYYRKLQGNQEFQPIRFDEILPFEFTKTDMPICNTLFQKGEHGYRCYDCQVHEITVWCVSCFQQSQHKGHRYTLNAIQGGGTCDCGNSQSMSPEGFCRKHKGKLVEPQIDQSESMKFDKYLGQIWKWILQMYKVQRKNSLTMLIHLCIYLDKLNDHSLVYNVLTERWLRKGEPTIVIDHLMRMGSEHFDTLLSKFANQMLLKLFSLDSVKELLAEKFIVHYNQDERFQSSDFKYLFPQLFLNYELVEKVIPRINSSIVPRRRDFDTQEYNNLLKCMGKLRRESAKIFFKPIIQAGGIIFQTLNYIDKNIEESTYNMDYIYRQHKYRRLQQKYYQVTSVFANIFQDQPNMLAQEIRNQYAFSCKNIYKKNKVMIPHHRFLTLLVFVYFGCDLEAIDANKVAQILRMDKNQFIQFIGKYLNFFLKPLKEFSLTMANRDDGKYDFDDHIEFYVVDSKLSQAYLYDMLGLKVLAMMLYKLGEVNNFAKALESLFQEEKAIIEKDQHWIRRDIDSVRRQLHEERQMYKRHSKGRNMPPEMFEEMEFQRHFRHGFGRGNKHQSAGQFMRQTQRKLARSAQTHFLEWIHFLHFLIEITYVERAEVILANRCGIKNAKNQSASEKQMISLFKNAKELTVQQMQTLYPFWFGEQIDKELLLKVATFDKTKKKYILKEHIQGTPFFKDLLHSFLGNDTYLKYTSKPIQLNTQNKALKQIILPDKVISIYVQRLFQEYKTRITFKNVLQIRYFAGLIKLVGFVLGRQDSKSKDFKARILAIAQSFSIASQISLIFDQEGQILPKQQSQTEKRRLVQLKRRQKEKFNNLKKNANENIKKILDNQIQKMDVQMQSTDQCIICRGGGQLFYLGLYGESSFMFNALTLNGTYPYFHCCFHAIHFGCFLDLCKDQDKIACPLCKAVSNILLPSQNALQKNPNVLTFLNERLQIVSTLQAKNQQPINLNSHLTKCFVHIFFLNLLKKGRLSEKKIRVYRIIKQLLKKRYDLLSQIEKLNYHAQINQFSKSYNSGKQTSYPLHQLIQLSQALTLASITGQVLEQTQLNKLLSKINHLPSEDIQKSLVFAAQIFGSKNINLKIPIQGSASLPERIKLYNPPKNVRQLLKTRALQEGKCKFGHNAVVCIICSWKGCGDCVQAIDHTNKSHCKRSIYFNFITGGVIFIANTKRFKIDCLYISQVSGRSWVAKDKEDDYILDAQLYEQLIQSLLEENLTEFMTSQLKNVEVSDLF